MINDTTYYLTRARHVVPLLLVGVTACDLFGPEGPITELPRDLTVVEAELIEQANVFGLELLREITASDDRANIVLSPLSASMALGMTLNGADGATFDAMSGTLGYGSLDQADINDAYRGLIDMLTQLDPVVRFEIANSIWANENVPFHQAFFDAVRAAFDARTESHSFSDPATLEAINSWVSDNTDGLMDSIVDSLDPSLVMLLINAIYFEGSWTYEFDPDRTASSPFTREDGSTVDVDMMSISDIEVPFGGDLGYTAAELPYGGEAFSMVVVVPWDEPREFVAGLDEARWTRIVDGLSPTELDGLSLPKLTIEYDAYLNESLRDMGMDVAFKPGADFSRMSPIGNQLCIDFVRQKTFLEVDEQGTRAAAVTGVGVGPVSFTGLIADRPFVFAIRERLTGTILFVGLIGDPSAADPGPEPYEKTCG